ncbi:glycerol-3-phosphate ABC transporter ATP-binding protein [Labrys miyagiensis]|uniref:Glycerol-3-phosphate ABC transporter ATP-binding protein n=1 Tax=Labrys miyagiensis TaxID=346912 RepID=A0ABQ6CVY9_9HYPH|nr:ATP-binding cassette domain-containing protein [Labrys miyagiensis]GLS23155.1 glycerol-3-phosphate ABC transporter ATP-binding protein [Labrys miyagiensis]
MATLSFKSVGKRFADGTLALANVDLDVRDGEFLVLVGPSGCGKSTLLRSAAGLEDLSQGRVLIGGRDVTDADPGDRDVAMVFQNYALYPHMDVYENMAFGLGQRKVPATVIREKVEKAARILDLSHLLKRKPGALSGGQRQRVAMGRAIVRDPQCFLMDEPLSNLDAKLRVQMRAELKLLNAQLGVTTLYVTHDQVEAMTMGDRVAVLRPVSAEGESNLQQCAPPRELYENPVNLFVAGFIGSPSMNFFQMHLGEENGAAYAAITGSPLRLPIGAEVLASNPKLASWKERDIVLGLRPEAFRLPVPSGQGLPVEVLLTEMTGADAYLFFDLPIASAVAGTSKSSPGSEAAITHANRITARVEPPRLPERGDRIEIGVDMTQARFFAPDTGLAIR